MVSVGRFWFIFWWIVCWVWFGWVWCLVGLWWSDMYSWLVIVFDVCCVIWCILCFGWLDVCLCLWCCGLFVVGGWVWWSWFGFCCLFGLWICCVCMWIMVIGCWFVVFWLCIWGFCWWWFFCKGLILMLFWRCLRRCSVVCCCWWFWFCFFGNCWVNWRWCGMLCWLCLFFELNCLLDFILGVMYISNKVMDGDYGICVLWIICVG